MNPILKYELYNQWIQLRRETGLLIPDRQKTSPNWDGAEPLLMQNTFKVATILKSLPCTQASQLAEQTGLSKMQIALAYKLIQRSPNILTDLKASANSDYFRVVNNYFNNGLFTIVFFLGQLFPDYNKKSPANPVRLTKKVIKNIFHDLETLKAGGTEILIKISDDWGAVTDTQALEYIIQYASALNIRVKLQTCGTLVITPGRRSIALSTDDIRINLNTSDQDQYDKLFGLKTSAQAHKKIPTLKRAIKKLIEERNHGSHQCRIGLNSFVSGNTCNQILPLITLAKDMGVDYVDFKPDLYAIPTAIEQDHIDQEVAKAKKINTHPSYRNIYINFTDTLSMENLFWHPWSSMFDALKQTDHKIFIDSSGNCSPVDYGASAHPKPLAKKGSKDLSIGKLSEERGLLEVIQKTSWNTPVPIREFNPFDMMLALEIIRNESDEAWGIPAACNPYRPSLHEELPMNIMRGYWETK